MGFSQVRYKLDVTGMKKETLFGHIDAPCVSLRYKLVVEVTEELLKTARNHLPKDDEDETCNPVLVALLSELMAPPQPPVSDSHKVTLQSYALGKKPGDAELVKKKNRK